MGDVLNDVDDSEMVYVGRSSKGAKLHIARFPWKPGPAWCGVPITGKIHFRLDTEGPEVCRRCILNIDRHLDAKYRPVGQSRGSKQRKR